MTIKPLDPHAGPRDSADTMGEAEAQELAAADAEAKDAPPPATDADR